MSVEKKLMDARARSMIRSRFFVGFSRNCCGIRDFRLELEKEFTRVSSSYVIVAADRSPSTRNMRAADTRAKAGVRARSHLSRFARLLRLPRKRVRGFDPRTCPIPSLSASIRFP
jgi:hypothetical protein